MKASEIRELTADELDRKLDETRQELFNLRFQHATGALDNTAALARVKRDIAVREGQRKGPPERGPVCRQKVETRRSLLRFGAFVRLVRR